MKEGHKVKALALLNLLRNQATYNFDACFRLLLEELYHANLTLEEIGTCRAEISQLRAHSYTNLARFYLEALRLGNTSKLRSQENYASLLNVIKNSGLTPEEIGTSMEELMKLRPKNEK